MRATATTFFFAIAFCTMLYAVTAAQDAVDLSNAQVQIA